MSFKYISDKHKKDTDLPHRAHELKLKRSLLNGTFYDVLPHEWDEEQVGNDYIPLKKRKPSVRTGTNLLRAVVEDSAAMLFGEGRFPDVIVANESDLTTQDVIAALIKESNLVEKMRSAVFQGSIGSVAIYMRVLSNRKSQNRVFFDVKDTINLTPKFYDNEPDQLQSITEKYKIKGHEVRALGYPVKDDALDRDFWFQRIFDEAAERWFIPWPVTPVKGEQEPEVEDPQKTVVHSLGFCPWVWIKNLHGGDEIDGGCTFQAGIETCLEIDALASQEARGLRYSMDPMLVLKEAASEEIPASAGAELTFGDGIGPVGNPAGKDAVIKSAANALVMDAEGDAKYLEINGSAASVVNETIEKLRGYAIEAMHGSKVNPDQINSHQGAKALEILHAPLIRLTDCLRASYGEHGLLSLIRMFVEASRIKTIHVCGKLVKDLAEPHEIALRWHSWFPETESDLQQQAVRLTTLVKGGLLSRETAVEQIAAPYHIEKVQDELSRIEGEQQEAAMRAVEQAQALAATKPQQEREQEVA